MNALDQQRVAKWIRDAFSILCVRLAGRSAAERNLRLAFESLLRQLRIAPLAVVARAAPAPYRRITATTADLRHIVKALDSCLAVYRRYEAILTPAQREMQRHVQDTRRFAAQELEARRFQATELIAV